MRGKKGGLIKGLFEGARATERPKKKGSRLRFGGDEGGAAKKRPGRRGSIAAQFAKAAREAGADESDDAEIDGARASTSAKKRGRVKRGRPADSRNQRTQILLTDYDRNRARNLSDEAARSKTAAKYSKEQQRGEKAVRLSLDRALRRRAGGPHYQGARKSRSV